MAAYIIVNYDVDDADLYGEYQADAGPALKVGTECKVLVVDPASDVLEGDDVGHQTVVLEFDSIGKAKEIYHSDAYQAVLPKRLRATSKHSAVLVNGFG
ncbi:MAG: DUF1330 domain-containing protein [Acidimicrobiia bacterium]|nr:DUF1330 domain-containing protein [Acidimicrobiia bacterium]